MFLLKELYRINITIFHYSTILHEAIIKRNIEIVKTLLARMDIDIDHKIILIHLYS